MSKKSSENAKGDAKADPLVPDLGQFMVDMVSNVTSNALQLAQLGGRAPGKLARVFLLDSDAQDDMKPDALQLLADAGAYLKDARRVAGLTVDELGAAMDLKDRSLLEAVEKGTATLSFDLILRLASLLARHDPLPFVMQLARAHNPKAWSVMDKWGLGRASRQLERERSFVNILRQHDSVRDLSDSEFERVRSFCEQALALALSFREAEDDEEELED
ncbi:MAG: multiprotein-bridging factor 1 family protein [Gammaproteobacteria bacterium]